MYLINPFLGHGSITWCLALHISCAGNIVVSGISCEILLCQVWTSLGPNKEFTLVPVIYPRGPWPLQLQVSCKNTSDVCQNILISALLPDRTLFSTTYVVMPTPSRLNKRRYQTQIIRWPDKTYQNPWWQICWWRWILNRRRIIKIKLKLKVEIKNPQS